LIEDIEDSFSFNKYSYRKILKKILEYLWGLFMKEHETFHDIVREENEFQLLFRLFNEIMKEDNIKMELFLNFNKKTLIGDFVFYYLESFPQSNQCN